MWSKEQHETKEAERAKKRADRSKKPWWWLRQSDPTARFTAYLAIFTFCLLVVSFFQWASINAGSADTHDLAVAAKDQAVAAKIAAEAAKVQAEAAGISAKVAESVAAANISIKSLFHQSISDESGKVMGWNIAPRFFNTGTTNTVDLVIANATHAFTPDDIKGFDFRVPEYIKIKSRPQNISGQQDVRAATTFFPIDDIIKVRDGKYLIITWGQAAFSDVFGHRHLYEYCFSIEPIGNVEIASAQNVFQFREFSVGKPPC